MQRNLQESLRTRTVLRIRSPDEARDILKTLAFGLLLALIGMVWMFLGNAFFPGWAISEVYSRASAIPLWTFGMPVAMTGLALMLLAFPRCRAACGRHPVLFFAVVIVAIIVWLVAFSWAGFLGD